MSELYQKFGDFMGNLLEYIKSDYTLSGLVIMGLGVLCLVALIRNADWMLEGGNGPFNIATIASYNRTLARYIMAIPCVLIILLGILILCLGLFF